MECGECRSPLDERADLPADQREPCPNCGSRQRHFKQTVVAQQPLRASFVSKARAGGKGKSFIEMKVGWSFFRRTASWHFVEQIVDRRHNRYRKKVVDEETGATLRNDDGPLDEHQGFGSAKKPQS